MPTNRAAAESLCLKVIAQMLPGGQNAELYKKKFESMNDKQFAAFMQGLKEKTIKLVVVVPNGAKERLDVERNIKIAEGLGKKVFQRVWMPAKNDSRAYLTPIPYLLFPIPLRRQAQLLSKKISIPEDNQSVDNMTGQPTGKSAAARCSYPEVKVLAAMGLDASLRELLKFRGGDEGGYRAMNTMIDRTGSVSLDEIAPYATGVKSTLAMKNYLKACHFKSTL
jgi:hypothetical protein